MSITKIIRVLHTKKNTHHIQTVVSNVLLKEFDADEPVELPVRVQAAVLKITPIAGADVQDIEVDDLKVFACFKQEQTTIVTTPEGVTTQRTTSIAFTTTGAVITTEISTVEPQAATGLCHKYYYAVNFKYRGRYASGVCGFKSIIGLQSLQKMDNHESFHSYISQAVRKSMECLVLS